MTIQGAIAELKNLLEVDDVPFYYKSAIKKVIETIQTDCSKCAEYGSYKCTKGDGKMYFKTEPLQTCSVNGRPYSECSSCEHFRCTADEPQNTIRSDTSMDYLKFMDELKMDEELAKRFEKKGADDEYKVL